MRTLPAKLQRSKRTQVRQWNLKHNQHLYPFGQTTRALASLVCKFRVHRDMGNAATANDPTSESYVPTVESLCGRLRATLAHVKPFQRQNCTAAVTPGKHLVKLQSPSAPTIHEGITGSPSGDTWRKPPPKLGRIDLGVELRAANLRAKGSTSASRYQANPSNSKTLPRKYGGGVPLSLLFH